MVPAEKGKVKNHGDRNPSCRCRRAPLPSPEADRLLLGGRFKAIRSLGQGGMGEIMLAKDVKLGRKVAIKSIRAGPLHECDAQAFFLREMEAASRLKHPNICTIYEIVEEKGRKFIVMQYVDGITLDILIRVKILSIDQIINIATQIADGMAAAQRQRIVHCDIKPNNIMIDRSGQVKILDFGLAKFCTEPDKDADVENERRDRDLIEKGVVLGTASCMSPEQAKGLKLDGRSDVFAFGVVLYEMIENRHPFSDEEDIVTLHNILHRQVQFSRPAPAALRAIVSRSLQKDRDCRFRDFAEIRKALAALGPPD